MVCPALHMEEISVNRLSAATLWKLTSNPLLAPVAQRLHTAAFLCSHYTKDSDPCIVHVLRSVLSLWFQFC